MSRIASGYLAVAICDRCSFRYPYNHLKADGNCPGMRVCQKCWDPIDRYRLPPRQPDAITLQNPRPDTPLIVDPDFFVRENGQVINDSDNDGLGPTP